MVDIFSIMSKIFKTDLFIGAIILASTIIISLLIIEIFRIIDFIWEPDMDINMLLTKIIEKIIKVFIILELICLSIIVILIIGFIAIGIAKIIF